MKRYYAVSKQKGLERSGLKAGRLYHIHEQPPTGQEEYIAESKVRLYVYRVDAKEGEIGPQGERLRVVQDVPAQRVLFEDVFLTEHEEQELEEKLKESEW